MGIAPASKGGQHGEVAPETRARSSESGWKLWSSVKGEVPIKKRNDPPGYPGDDRITQWYNKLKEMVREERGLSEAEHVMRSTYEDAVRRCAPIQGDWHSVPCHARGAQIDSRNRGGGEGGTLTHIR